MISTRPSALLEGSIAARTPKILYRSARPLLASKAELRWGGNLNVIVLLPAKADVPSGGAAGGDCDDIIERGVTSSLMNLHAALMGSIESLRL